MKGYTLLLLFILLSHFPNDSPYKQGMKIFPVKTEVCPDIDAFLRNLLKAKLRYEKDLFHNKSSEIEKDKKLYFNMVTAMKKRKAIYLNCFDMLLRSKEHEKEFIRFVYYPSYLNTIPKCGLMSYRKYVELVMYNLQNLNEDEFELKCE